jgi:hypothetical protein
MFARAIDKVRRLAECDLEGLSALDDFLSALLSAQHDRRARGTMLVLLQSAAEVPEHSAAWPREEGLT